MLFPLINYVFFFGRHWFKLHYNNLLTYIRKFLLFSQFSSTCTNGIHYCIYYYRPMPFVTHITFMSVALTFQIHWRPSNNWKICKSLWSWFLLHLFICCHILFEQAFIILRLVLTNVNASSDTEFSLISKLWNEMESIIEVTLQIEWFSTYSVCSLPI